MWNEHDITDTLEQLIDSTSLQTVLDCLATICEEKAVHIRSSYNDTSLAKQWHKHADKLYTYDTNGD